MSNRLLVPLARVVDALPWPSDVSFFELSRTVCDGRVVEERIVCFTHDGEAPEVLPGIAPTGRYVELPQVVVRGAGFERVYWDQASLLSQVGLLDPSGLPVVGIEAAYKLKDATLVDSNRLVKRWASSPVEIPSPRPRPRIGDLGAMLDEHLRGEFALHDADATMATMADEPVLIHVPTLTGGVGTAEVYRFYKHHFIPGWPGDVCVTPVSRSVGESLVVDERIVSFTHELEMDAILPGVAPTGRRVEVPHAVVVGFHEGLVAWEHIYWDQAGLLLQLGIIDPDGLPIRGADAATRLREMSGTPSIS